MINILVNRYIIINFIVRFMIVFVVKIILCVLCELCEWIKCIVVEKVVDDVMFLVLSFGLFWKLVVFGCDGGVEGLFCLFDEVIDLELMFLDVCEMLRFLFNEFGFMLVLGGWMFIIVIRELFFFLVLLDGDIFVLFFEVEEELFI